MPGSLSHLANRFFDVLLAQPLNAEERRKVMVWLPTSLLSAFDDQSHADQRHGYSAAQSVISDDHGESDTVIAALMHDVGKRWSELGVFGRSLASILIKLGWPLTERMALYRDHGPIGAAELESLDAPGLAVAYAMHHHGERPMTITEDQWEALERADEPPKARTLIRARIR